MTYDTPSKPETRDLLPAGGSFTFPAPSYPVSKWTSSNSKIASVSKTGKVTAKKAGKVTITAVPKVKKGETAPEAVTYTITIEKPTIKGTTLRTFTGSKVTDFIKGTDKLKPSSFVSSKSDVLSIDANGVMTAHKSGKATITVFYPDGAKVKATFTVKLPNLKEVSGKITEGKKKKLTIRNKFKDVRMVSSNPNVATVDDNGKLIAVYPGRTEIRLMVGSKVYDTCAVEVLEPYFKTQGTRSLKIGKSLTPSVKNRGPSAFLYSSNENVVSVRGKKLKAVGSGTATIWLKIGNTTFSSFTVTVP